MRLRPEVRAAWVDRLRNGNLPQGRGALQNEDGFCCLGVLCEVAIDSGLELSKVFDSGYWKYRYDDVTDMPPAAVEKWAFGEADAAVWAVEVDWSTISDNEYGVQSSWHELTELNDSAKLTFAQIADLIEKDGEKQ